MLLEEIYYQLMIAFGYLSCILSLCFVFLQIPPNKSLGNYRIMRKAITVAYLIVGLLHFVEVMNTEGDIDPHFSIFITITVASFQACLFTYALITLLDIHFVKTRKLIGELLIIAVLSSVCILFYVIENGRFFHIPFYIFAAYYVVQLVRYTRIFMLSFRNYRTQMDNYFSEQESDRLRWVVLAFYSALAIGILAIVIIFIPFVFTVIAQAIMIVYYLFFGILFINYAFRFHDIEKVMIPEKEIDSQIKKENSLFAFKGLNVLVEKWVNEKRFTEQGITIERMAAELGTNRTYLSNFINTKMQMNFKTWISHLRVEEAKRKMLENPEFSISEIAQKTGYIELSNFSRQFSLITGTSPSKWCKENL